MKRSRAWYALIALSVFLVAINVHDLLVFAGIRSLVQGWSLGAVTNIIQVALCVVGIALAHRVGIKQVFCELGICAPVGRAFVFAFISSLPMLIAFAATSSINPRMSVMSIGIGCFVAPFAEELLYRGYAFHQLYRWARWGFWLSVIIPSVLFALGHAYQAQGFWDLAGILAITGLGSVLFCWIFIRWQDNLWAVFGLHSLMNLWWEVFAVDDTALGGWLANVARLLTVALAIVLTVFKDRIWRPLPAEG